jgi:hypothetical protein
MTENTDPQSDCSPIITIGDKVLLASSIRSCEVQELTHADDVLAAQPAMSARTAHSQAAVGVWGVQVGHGCCDVNGPSTHFFTRCADEAEARRLLSRIAKHWRESLEKETT